MTPLERRIAANVANPDKVQKLISDLLLSERPDAYLRILFLQAVSGGHFHSYRHVVPIIFARVDIFRVQIKAAIRFACLGPNRPLLKDLIDRLILLPRTPLNRTMITDLLLWAVKQHDLDTAKYILREDEIDCATLGALIREAILAILAVDGSVDMLTLLLSNLMEEKKHERRASASIHRREVSDTSTFVALQDRRRAALTDGLRLTLQRKAYNLTAMLLPLCLQCLKDTGWYGDFAARPFDLDIPDDLYLVFTRKQCFAFLSEAVPASVRRAIFRRLGSRQVEHSEPRDIVLVVGEGRESLQEFLVHRDVLFYWSELFVNQLPGREKTKRGMLRLAGISAETFRAVVDFMYGEEYYHPQVIPFSPGWSNHRRVLERLWEAAADLGILTLRKEVEGLLVGLEGKKQ
ncbi:hypothetical protein BJX61DRAFT_543836 [Aspergillus egyptiacus]|nr:hypothetical protein BJX61DRAFT_543836 [Aspergillus egyptiacus]